jgi:glutathione S-transferase
MMSENRLWYVSTKLYVISGSHPSWTARLMLERKGIEYRRVDLLPVISKVALRTLGFKGVTVPALKIEGERIQGSREIARELDRRVPDPPLFPADAEARSKVEETEAWGDEVLQPAARRAVWNVLRRNRAPLRSYSEGARLGVPIGLAVRTAAPIVAMAARFNKATDENVRADIAGLPSVLQKIDDWIAAGVLGSEQPNAADLQIAPSVRLMMTLDDLRPAIEPRPAGKLALRLVPDFPGHAEPTVPRAWLEPLHAG